MLFQKSDSHMLSQVKRTKGKKIAKWNSTVLRLLSYG